MEDAVYQPTSLDGQPAVYDGQPTGPAGKEKYVFIETFGCQMNDNDSMRMLAHLKDSKYLPTDEPASADLILINTCSIRDKAEQKFYSAAGKYRELKEKNPSLIIGISGCVAQQAGAGLLKRIPYVDMVIGTHNVHNVPELVEEISDRRGRLAGRPDEKISRTEFRDTIGPGEYAAYGLPYGGGVKASVSIMRGCDNFCTYCIVPSVRGKEASRPCEDILDDVKRLADQGVKEITLLGQNVNSYRPTSRSQRPDGPAVTFPGLLRLVCAVDPIERVRFVTSHPKDMSTELIYLFGEEAKKLSRNVHLPLQSGSDSVLGRMKRGYTVAGYLSKVALLRRLYPDISITTDIIAGFPGESGEDFEKTVTVLREVEFDGVFSFKYSPRPNTAAAGFSDQVPAEVAQERLLRIQEIQKGITAKKMKALVGRNMDVLVEGESNRQGRLDGRQGRPTDCQGRPTEMTGRTPCNRVVNFPGPRERVGAIVGVLITGACSNSLRGIQ
ncbi:MAG: tRNA (N6-isopentenyl adenosine(37)-C2)-methylthiotransferase MiaB [Deltaproteobacteria bacterium]|nr:tRNA (N6-isopentenyl adenosine(37)-C2)-methylthiotransferase MiaB [Deltaproteobacteria bacterium]